MKKLILSFLLSPIIFADIVGGIAVTVNDETITLYEIKEERAISKLSIKQTVDLLIRTKLEKIEADNRNISVSNQEVLDELKKMAEQNNMTLSQLYEAMSSARNLSESQTKTKIKEKLLKQKLFDAIAMSQMEEATDEEIEEYYNLHIDEFRTPKTIDTVVYTSANKDALQQKIISPMMNFPSVQTQSETIEVAKINPRLAQLLIKTKDGSFTPVLPQGAAGYMAFYVIKKNELNTPPLELVRGQIQSSLMDQKREQVLSDHFQRMRVNADIKVLRLPKE